MKILFAADHGGFEMKNELMSYVRDVLSYEVEDCGATELNQDDDYTDFIHCAAKAVSQDIENAKAIILGGSGQGEAMVANKYPGVRAAVYYGDPQAMQVDAAGTELGIIESTRIHNDANVLSLGARFLTVEQAKVVVRLWLRTEFSGDERHKRRISKIDI